MTSCGKVENPILCAGGCGFYGTSSNHNLCSQCYKDFLKEEEAKNIVVLSEKISSLTFHEGTTTENVDSTMKIKQRCMTCKKKVGLIGFSCRCKGMFCSVHRYPEEHSCTFDYKSFGRVTLAKENPPCRHDKLKNRI
ncbi:hypothetical protein MTR67_032729 [Solanum verrucosum]|uniref:Uncharacterized protein n=1 Tax=Solanum verrucosum TaxID=315347 RepID=A0AAF0U528_SOLVR|nr:hypothetical protein MTR67_032729 [Solanum verrucosum]